MDHVARLARACAARGFDATAAGRRAWCPPSSGLPDGGDAVFVIGNSNTMWPRFVAALRAAPARAEDGAPLERWIEDELSAACAETFGAAPRALRFAHDGPPWLAIQRVAQACGLAWLAPCHLSIHPRLGPWLSLRAVVTFDAEIAGAAPALSHPCGACANACAPAFARAVAAGTDLEERPDTWIAVRDACSLGRAHRFDEAHLRYGYTKDREILRRLLGPA